MRVQFENYIDNALTNISGDYVDIVSGNVHRAVGGYPGNNHRMPICCEVMYNRMKSNDEILYAPPKGKGATLKIRYYNRGCEEAESLQTHNRKSGDIDDLQKLRKRYAEAIRTATIKMFEVDMLIYHKYRKELDYEARIIENSINSDGGYNTALKFCSGIARDGFLNLYKMGLLKYSLEALVVKHEYSFIFPSEQVEKCKILLKQYGYPDIGTDT